MAIIIKADAAPFEPTEQQLKPLSELLNVAVQITVQSIPQWGEDRGWTYDVSNLNGLKPGWDATAEDIQSLLDDERSQAAQQIREATEQLLENEDINSWEDEIAAIILLLLLGAYGLGKGGQEQISASDLDYLQVRLRNQLTFLRGFAEAILAGQLTPNQIRARAVYYSSDSRLGYDQGLRVGYQLAGWNWERNILAIAEHCPGCLEETAKGWQPIGTLSPLGSRECRFNELCHWEFSSSIEQPGDEVRLRSFVMDRWGWL